MEFFLFRPQMRTPFEKLVTVAKSAEAAGFIGIAGMDHLLGPGAEDQIVYEAMVTNTWLAAHTTKLKVGSLVMCDAFRNPALLAQQVVSLDHASGGRFELGLGWGSYKNDFTYFGLEPSQPRDRVQRLRETLEVLRLLWSGEVFDFDGEFLNFHSARSATLPLGKIPITIGGAKPRTLALVRDFADWWNLDVRYLEELAGSAFQELRGQAGRARISIQEMVAYVPHGADRAAITKLAMQRFAYAKPVIGTGSELIEHFQRRAALGVERTYVWFCDFASAETLAGFGAEVIGKM
jgi:alkanesulfonate monooxygenase SsuD/methylene tetrahydromethanopterin reductase-like flavin-dependent oxidoreductase (luciferase family)